MEKKSDCINKAFREGRKDDISEWLKQNSFLVVIILLPILTMIIGVIIITEGKEYVGSIQGKVIYVYYQPRDIIGPELNRFVKVELKNGHKHTALNDTLNVGDEVSVGKLVSKRNRYSYFIERN